MKRAVVALGVSLLVVASSASCTGDTSSPRGSTAPQDATATTVPVDAAPATGVVTGDDPRAQEIVDLVEQAMPELELQTVAFGVWVGDEQVVRGAIDAPSVQPATATDAIVRVGQPMEAMLGTILLQLGAEGVVDLDEPVATYLPDLVNGDRITPRMLANSTGGTPDYVPDPGFEARVNANPFAGYTFDELLGYAQKTPPLFEPGTSWAYSHTEMAALVELLEEATGQSLEDLMASRIFEPLGMTASSAHKNNAIAEPAMHAYTNSRGVYEETTFWDPTWGLNGGMNASVADLGRWLRALNTGELLDEADAAESLSPVTAGMAGMTDERYFTYGSLVTGNWIVGNPSLNGYMGFTAQQRDPSVTIVVWSTAALGSAESSNASVTISERIAAVVSDDPFSMKPPA
jgi:D-alanyl-D-alanine carboxypeptidase